MKKSIILFCAIFLLVKIAHSEDQWTSFLTNNSSTDYINGIVTEGNTVWCATNGGVVKWNTLTGTHTVYSFSDPNGNVIGIVSAAIDWNGLKWFGSRGSIYAYNDTSWFSFTGDSQTTRNLLLNGLIRSIAIDSVNKRVIFKILKGVSEFSYVLLSWDAFDGGKWEELLNFSGNKFFPYYPIVVDTVNPWDIWVGGYIDYLYYFKKTDQGYTQSVLGGKNMVVSSLAIDYDNNIWMVGPGADSGKNVALYDRYKNTTTVYLPSQTGGTGYLVYVVIDHKWIKWFGSDESLIRYDNKTWTGYPYIKKSEFDHLTALGVDERGDIWMGRANGPAISGYGLYRFHPPQTGVNEEDSIPQTIKIIGNSPNPFNPSTTISYSLSSPCKTELAVYSTTGQRIRALVSGSQTAGSHSVIWDGSDDSGKPVSSGVYLSRLTGGKSSVTGKMLLLR